MGKYKPSQVNAKGKLVYAAFPLGYWSVPNEREAWHKKYEEYQKSDRWESLKERAFNRHDGHCALCGKTAQVPHHAIYPKERFGTEKDTDITPLCNDCHNNFHNPPCIEELRKQNELSPTGKCPYCNMKMVEYQHGLSKGVIGGLIHLNNYGGGPVNLKELGLTRNQWDNFQKLRYWGLVNQCFNGTVRQAGVWEITELGRAFIDGRIAVPKRVRTYRGKTVGKSEEMVMVWDVDADYKKKPDYVADMIPVAPQS